MTFSSICLATLLSGGLQAPQPVRLELGPDGEMLGYLASGPFPNVGALELKGTGFKTDYLQGEADTSAVEGKLIPMIPSEQATDPRLTNPRKPGWILATGNTTTGVDLAALLNGSKPAIAYLYTTLESPKDQDAQILFGSDDGAKVYVNGKLLFQKQIARGIKRDEDHIQIHLNQGSNVVLFKIEQGDGGWGLLARVADLQGHGLKGVTEQIDVLPEGGKRVRPGEKWVRKVAGSGHTLDLASAMRYEELSTKAAKWVDRFRTEALDPDQLDYALRNSASRLATDGDPSHGLKTACDEVQLAYDHARSKLLAETQKADSQFKTSVNKEDYARVMSGGRYFVHADGTAFIPIGYNHNPDWQEFEEANPLRDDYNPDETGKYIAHLRAKGVNTIRLMIETPPSGNLENPLGTFSPEHVRWIDNIVADARLYGIKLIMTPWDTFWMNLRSETSPYYPPMGGPLKRKVDFIIDPEMRKLEKNRIRYMIDRWGNTGTVFAWELLNEGDLWWGETPGQLKEWIDDVSQYARAYEHQKWGRNHLLSVSISQAMPKGELATDAYNLPDLDYATTHLYIGASKAPTEPVQPSMDEKQGVDYCLDHITDRRPYMDTENGPIDHWIDSESLDDQVFLGMIWAHMASGAAGSGFRWPYRHPHHLTEGMLESLRCMDQFARVVPWEELAGDRVPITATGEQICCFGTGKALIVWSGKGGTVKIHWPHAPSLVYVTTYDCLRGQKTMVKRVPLSGEDYEVKANSTGEPAAILLSTHAPN